jgi:hypothetical protein
LVIVRIASRKAGAQSRHSRNYPGIPGTIGIARSVTR